MARLLGILVWGFALLYVLALVVFLLGQYGLAGVARDPLSGVYLILLGQPWVRGIDLLPERLWPAGAVLAPLVTLLILRLLAGLARRRRRG